MSKKTKQTQKNLQSTPPKKLRHFFDVWHIGFVIFSLGILFIYFLSTGFVLGYDPKIPLRVTIKNENVVVPDVQEPIKDTRVEALNGELVDPKTLHNPVAVMIDNLIDARPQSGLQSASLIYETVVESSITRFMAIFDHDSELAEIGPVRSARPYFVQLVDAYDAPYAHAGGSPEALLKIREYGVKDLTHGKYFRRVTHRSAPHNLYTSSASLLQALQDFSWHDDPQTFGRWSFSDAALPGTLETTSVDLYYSGSAEGSHVRFEYVPELLTYKRFQAGQSHEDANTDAQVMAKTIVVQEIPGILSTGDHGRLKLNVLGEGKAHFVFDGKRITGTWKKSETQVQTSFYDENGEEMIFPRGLMFIELVPQGKSFVFLP